MKLNTFPTKIFIGIILFAFVLSNNTENETISAVTNTANSQDKSNLNHGIFLKEKMFKSKAAKKNALKNKKITSNLSSKTSSGNNLTKSKSTFGTNSKSTFGTNSKSTVATKSKSTVGTNLKSTVGTNSKSTVGTNSKSTVGTNSKSTVATNLKSTLGTSLKSKTSTNVVGRNDEKPWELEGPILQQSWIKYFKYTVKDGNKNILPSNFKENEQFFEQAKYFPNANLEEKKNGIYKYNRDSKFFILYLFENLISINSSLYVKINSIK